ncbi:acyl-CoA dehydrogenase family protein [Actinomadura sp. DC4]|uniref:acyl-CoA dehydrogenase family protein n=1 Tax=Actinomadura sp. DC4 TaxID=3055069 RepID=UPI0025B18AF3|nr:acyl-CoA dehydrogenase family protein [Actinomadura sp. DC4]MDN3356450.1 acyl-CoA dehydrogenase family protein [Actinomadura sp. DC4]
MSFPLVEQATSLGAARHLCYEASPAQGQRTWSKWRAPKPATEVVHQALPAFGRTGYATESPQGQRLRDVVGLEIGDHTARIARLVVARRLLGREYAP